MRKRRCSPPIVQDKFLHLQPKESTFYNNSNIEMILGQDVFDAIKLLEHFHGRNQNTSSAVRLPIG